MLYGGCLLKILTVTRYDNPVGSRVVTVKHRSYSVIHRRSGIGSRNNMFTKKRHLHIVVLALLATSALSCRTDQSATVADDPMKHTASTITPQGSVHSEQGEETDVESRGLLERPGFSRRFPPPTDLGGAFTCTKDQGDPQGTAGRDLSGAMFTETALTNSTCRAWCASRGYAFAGTQVGNYCFCGNSFGRSGPANNCNVACGGKASEICGGIWANSVSVTGVGPPPIPSNGGRCVTSIQGSRPNPGNPSKTDRYNYTEIQLWVVTGIPVQRVYPVQWTATGSGEFHTDDGLNRVDASWGISGASLVHFEDQINLSTSTRRVSQQDPIANAQLVGSQQKITGSMIGMPGPFSSSIPESVVSFSRPAPDMTPITNMTQQTNVIGKIMQQSSWATGTTICHWNLAVVP